MPHYEDDPVVAEYDVFITPEIAEQLYVLQYLNRPLDDPLTQATDSEPSQLRMKQQSGFIEVDVPIDVHSHYNRPMGVTWGEAMRKTKDFGQRSYGIAAGFERTMPRTSRPGPPLEGAPPQAAPAEDDDMMEEYITNFEDANEKGHVLNTQTFGGQIIRDDARGPNYMLGTFRQNQLHLTKLSGIVQLRTQFHYIDAVAQLEAAKRRREKETQEGAKPAEPKAFLPTVKKAGGDTSAELMQAFLKSTNLEKWHKLSYADENSETAYQAFEETLFLEDVAAAPKLHSNMNSNQYLDAISAPSGGGGKSFKKKSTGKRQERFIEVSDESDLEVHEQRAKSHTPNLTSATGADTAG